MRLNSADTLRALMVQNRISMGMMADYVGCSKGFISHLLAERRRSCTPLLADRISRVLHVPTSVLFVETKSPTAVQNVKQREKVPA
ncbi:Uncharacterised protein [Arthrobacter agilis]|uniref:helix-turn-helix domain-containing protein n=1 Tax=Arthrobacter agilis TaxID=37921 RepID=UPI000F6CCA06|nr:helix-turn-helix transcriptional regulator [Arthrobacter agilis]VDR32512.1 Uncharacterised protein [Arthrobacter agilis]